MPTRTDTQIDGFVWCCDPMCDGNEQRPAPLVRTTEVYTYGEVDPESVFAAFPERSCERLAPANDEHASCPVCSKHVDVSVQKRPTYHSMMRGWDGKPFDQGALLKLMREKPADEKAVTNDVDVLKAQMAELRAELRAATAEKTQEPEKRGPGRPRKQIEGDD